MLIYNVSLITHSKYMKIFKAGQPYLEQYPRLVRFIEMTVKTFCVLFFPVLISIFSILIWALFFYQNGVRFDDGMEIIVTSSWIPVFGILYSLFTAIVLSSVWGEYKTIRRAVKQWDIDTFMDLSDEEMSPLVHALVLTFSIAILLAFMLLDYPSFSNGLVLIGSTSYLLSLIFLVIIEIDNPCSGFWFIKSIPEEWLRIDPKTWREQRAKEIKQKFLDNNS